MASPRPGAVRWVAAIAVLLGADLLASGALLAERSAARWTTRAPAAAPSAVVHGRALPSRQPDAFLAAETLLARRADAVRAHDEPGFLDTVDPLAAPAFRAAQQRSLRGTTSLPLSSWSYEIEGEQLRELTAAQRARYAGAATYAPDVVLRYQLTGYDLEPAVELLQYTFVERAGRWYVGADGDLSAPGERVARAPWDFGTLRVLRGSASLVLFHPGSEQLAALVKGEADRAVPRVSAAWGRSWPGRVVVVVPRSRAELEQLIGEDDLGSIAAVATADLPTGASGERPVGDRVLINPEAFGRLGPVGRRVVLTHEVTHVATRRASPSGMPSWLVEGYADYVGFTGSGVPAAVAASELKRDLDAGAELPALPADTAFGVSTERLAQAYEGAWLAVRLLGDRLGAQGVAGFYAAVGAAIADGAAAERAVAQVLERTLRLSPAEFTGLWADYVRRQLR